MTPDAEAGRSGDAFGVRVGSFEGPLDLLLHLVRVNEVDITDLPIAEITRQYNAYLDIMRELSLEIAGEYLVMAATLAHIKSRMLLPPDPTAESDAGSGEDPRTELVEQLQEYQRYKQAAENLHAMDSVRSLIWTRDERVPDEFAGEKLLVVELLDLVAAFQKLLGRMGEEARLRIRRDDVSVADKINWLADVLRERGSADLLTLLAELPDRSHRIAAFLAVLEMVRLRLLVAFQRVAFDEVRIALRKEESS